MEIQPIALRRTYTREVFSHAWEESWGAVVQTNIKGAVTLAVGFLGPQVVAFWKNHEHRRDLLVFLSNIASGATVTAGLFATWFLLHLIWISPRRMFLAQAMKLGEARYENEGLRKEIKDSGSNSYQPNL